MENSNPFLAINAPITMPNNPVVKRRMSASCTLTNVRIIAEENNTETPSKRFEAAAIAIGSVLNGLKANPMAGKNTGAAWNSTVKAVNIPPTQTKRMTLNFFNKIPPIIILHNFICLKKGSY